MWILLILAHFDPETNAPLSHFFSLLPLYTWFCAPGFTLFPATAAAACCATKGSTTVELFSDSKSRPDETSMISDPTNWRYFLAIASQSATLSMRFAFNCPILTWEPSGDKCDMDRVIESGDEKRELKIALQGGQGKRSVLEYINYSI